MIKKVFLLFSLLFFSLGLSAECLYPVSLSERISNSVLIAEGQVISSSSFWNSTHTNIYTSHQVEITRVWKGKIPASVSIIEVITEGGVVGDNAEQINPSLQLNIGDVGVFLLHRSFPHKYSKLLNKPTAFIAYADQQGFLKYNVENGIATDVFTKYQVIEQLYPLLKSAYGLSVIEIKKVNWFNNLQSNIGKGNLSQVNNPNNGGVNAVNNSAPNIKSYSPSMVATGSTKILTISGTNFGANRGGSKVSFKKADGSAFVDALTSQYVSWSNTEIKVKVPANTATGVIEVALSAYGETNVNNVSVPNIKLDIVTGGNAFLTNNINNNGDYSFFWSVTNEFNANPLVKSAFKKGLKSWKCATYINWEVDILTTTVNESYADKVNVVRFDENTELPAGVLRVCASYWSGCSTNMWYVDELDLTFNSKVKWVFDPVIANESNYNFESVMLHDLGSDNDVEDVNEYVPEKSAELAVSISIIEGNISSCVGENLTFRVTAENGGSNPGYLWKKNGIEIPGANTGSYTNNNFADKDSITCLVTSNLEGVINSPATSNKIGLTIKPIPTADFTVNPDSTGVNKNVIITFIGTASVGATYTWNFDGAMLNSGTGKGPYSVKWTNQGNKNVTLSIIDNGCISSQVNKQVEVSPASTGIALESIEKLINIYPNPTTGIVTINNLSSVPIDRVELYDMSGKKLPAYYDISNNPNQQINLTLTHLSNAEYIVKLIIGTGYLNHKILLSR